jgi:hypothetical protein
MSQDRLASIGRSLAGPSAPPSAFGTWPTLGLSPCTTPRASRCTPSATAGCPVWAPKSCSTACRPTLECSWKSAPTLKVVLLCDGAKELVELLNRAFDYSGLGIEVWRLVDFWHVAEKLGAAASVIFGAAASTALGRWKGLLLNSDTAHSRILRELHASGKQHVRVGDEVPVRAAITYLQNQGRRMGFAAARAVGLPHRQRQRRGDVQEPHQAAAGSMRCSLEGRHRSTHHRPASTGPQRTLRPRHRPHTRAPRLSGHASCLIRIRATPLLVASLLTSAGVCGWGWYSLKMSALVAGLSHQGHDDMPEIWQTKQGRSEHQQLVAADEQATVLVKQFAHRCYLAGAALAVAAVSGFMLYRRRRLADGIAH